LHIHRPALLQAGSLFLVSILGVFALLRFNLVTLTLFCLGTAMAAGLSKLAVDAAIQERIPEQVRASAFAHSETVLMLAWVLGGATGLIPFPPRFGIEIAAIILVLATVRGIVSAVALRNEKLEGVASGEVPPVPEPEPATRRLPTRSRRGRRPAARDRAPAPVPPAPAAEPPTRALPSGDTQARPTRVLPREETEPESPGFHLYRPSGRPPVDDEDDG